MNSSVDSSINKSIRFVYDLQGISSADEEFVFSIIETLATMGTCCRDMVSHCIRVTYYSTLIGRQSMISASETSLLWYASIFHDIGKIKIPEEILKKPGRLTKHEYEIVKTHTQKGCEILKKNVNLEEAADIVLLHHERFDGKGYPIGKSGRDTPLLPRIIAVADAFDAMTSERPYQEALSLDDAIAELIDGKWTQFDGDIVDCFIDLLQNGCMKPKELNIAIGL